MTETPKKRVFIADDSLFFRMRLGEILADGGHEVTSSKDGRELIENILNDTKGIDILILDLHMPDMDGFEVLEWIKEKGYTGKFPIMVITSVYDPMEVIGRLKELGVARLISKAFTPEHIIFMVNNVLFSDFVAKGQKRVRVPVSIPVDFRIGERSLAGFILNISDNGLFLHTQEELLKGAVVHLVFALPHSEEVMKIQGLVRWTTIKKEEKTLFCGSGVVFSEISPEDQGRISDFIKAEAGKFGLE
ncbi:MAG: response regulator [Thermodesulfobacteriota bacterium]